MEEWMHLERGPPFFFLLPIFQERNSCPNFWKTNEERWKYNLGGGLWVTGLKEESRSHVGKLRDHKTNHFHCAASQYPLSELDWSLEISCCQPPNPHTIHQHFVQTVSMLLCLWMPKRPPLFPLSPLKSHRTEQETVLSMNVCSQTKTTS